MPTFSFDIVSEYDKAEMNNVFSQVEKAISGRYDFKNTPAEIDWMKDKTGFVLIGANTWQVEALLDIVRGKIAARGGTIKTLDLTKKIVEANLKATWELPFRAGIATDMAKEITAEIRQQFPKVKPQIQGGEIRVTSASKDDLQAVIRHLQSQEWDCALQFVNFR